MIHSNYSSPTNERSIIPADESYFEDLAIFLNQNHQIHRHLDWFTALDWLGNQPYLLEVLQGRIIAALCAAPENDEVAWIRVFGVRDHNQEDDPWHRLLPHAIYQLQTMGINSVAAISLHPWFERLLHSSGFTNRQNIVVLEWQGKLPQKIQINQELQIRPMLSEDLPIVAQIDHLAFPSLWQNSKAGLEKALNQTGISTVALLNGEIIGYQISTAMTIYGHLARLAVHPAYQRKGVAFSLVYDLLTQFKTRGFWRVTVNTQSDNKPSLKLYNLFGFTRTPEQIPVFELTIK